MISLPKTHNKPHEMAGLREGHLRLALPSDGDLHEPSLAFLRSCGIPVERPSSRSYSAFTPGIPNIDVLFQRTADITQKVEEGSAELGITGLDRYLELRHEASPVSTVIEDLGYGRCELVLAVPASWLDVSSLSDLGDVALDFRRQGKQLRIATKYPRLLRSFLHRNGINHFSLIQASGSLEAAPIAGYADLIADLTASGVTLRENGLKTLDDGTILRSQACLLGNRSCLKPDSAGLALARELLERMESHLRGGSFYRLTANVQGDSAETVSSHILRRPELAGLQGPTISKVYNAEEQDWYSVSLLVRKGGILDAVDHLRDAGAMDIAASPVSYLFEGHCQAYQNLVDTLEDN